MCQTAPCVICWPKQGDPLPIETIAPLFIRLCDAVQYAHEQGLIHRDIKPSNILLQHERHVLLADFGIALNVEDMRLTSTGMGLGTPEYTSPEQAQGMVDKRSDIYSLGIVLFELLTGQVPFKGRTPYEVFYKQTSAPVPSLREVYPNLPEPLTRLDPVIQKALAKEPEQRFQTASALGDAFQTALSGVAVAPDDLPAEIIAHEPARISGNGTGNETRANRGLVTPMDDDPLGERTTNPYSQPARFRGFPNRYAQVAQPAPRGGGGALIVTAMLALLLLAVATFAVIGFLLIENGGHSANTTPITIPTASPQLTPTLTPTNTPQRSPSPTPSPTATPTPSPSPTPSPTPTPPPPTPTP